MQEDKIKEAFKKIREDMNFFHQQIEEIKRTLTELMKSIETPTHNMQKPSIPTHIPTLQHSIKPYKAQNQGISTGNEGVPTLHPTNHPTLQHPPISTETSVNNQNDKISKLQQVSAILENLDELKKEVRFKFKRLTSQEMLIYSTIYQLEELGLEVDYSLVAEKLGLTTISIRDYVRKIINKDIPLKKFKEGNKKVRLTIPRDFKKLATLNTILELREL